jgi:peptidyl-dipeptidase Dcp
MAALPADNPFASEWTTPFGLPPFAAIQPAHITPALHDALARHMAEIDAIAGDSKPVTYSNVIDALERAGRQMNRVCGVFYNLAGADTNEALQAIEREMAPVMSRAA